MNKKCYAQKYAVSIALISTLSVISGSTTGVAASTSQVQSTMHARQTPTTALVEPKVPAMKPLAVFKTDLNDRIVNTDIQKLSLLMSGHSGDQITRGPDQLVYNLDLTIDPKLHEFSGHMSVHFHNNLSMSLSKLYFNVWPDSPHYRRAGGYEQVSNLTVGGHTESFSQNGTVLTVNLSAPIQSGKSATVSMDFLSLLPHIDDRYGWENTCTNLGNWCPLLAVYDQYGWITPPYYTDGESFYSLTGAFHVHATVPKDYELAASGDLVSTQNAPENRVTYNYDAIGVRDVALVGDPRFKVMSEKQGNTTVYTYYTPEEANQATLMEKSGLKALAYFGAHYGPYPYKTLRICAMRGWFGGMEYPQLVMISFQDGGNSDSETQIDVVHETAHQWFYGMIGDDQYLTPWIDEAFATFSESRADNSLSNLDNIASPSGHVTYPVSSFVSSDFGIQDNHYYDTVYNKGAQTLYHLQKLLGADRFDSMMKAYFQRYAFQVATTEDFMKFASSFSGQDLTPFFHIHAVYENDATTAPTDSWANLEMAENKRSWH